MTKLIEIEVPIAACSVCPCTVTPYATDAQLAELFELIKGGGAYALPVVRNSGGGYEVLRGWECVEVKRSLGHDRIRVVKGEFSDLEALNYAITEQARFSGAHWTSIAQSLSAAKRRYRIKDQSIARATGLSRTTVVRYIGAVEKLIPDLLLLAKLDRITFTTCRKLVTLSKSEQTNIADEAKNKQWSDKQFSKRLQIARTPASVAGQGATPVPKEKDIHVRRLEVTLSEQIGFPVNIDTADGHRGSIEYSFYSRVDMIEAITKLRKGFSNQAAPKGKIVIEYENLDDFQHLIGGFLTEE